MQLRHRFSFDLTHMFPCVCLFVCKYFYASTQVESLLILWFILYFSIFWLCNVIPSILSIFSRSLYSASLTLSSFLVTLCIILSHLFGSFYCLPVCLFRLSRCIASCFHFVFLPPLHPQKIEGNMQHRILARTVCSVTCASSVIFLFVFRLPTIFLLLFSTCEIELCILAQRASYMNFILFFIFPLFIFFPHFVGCPIRCCTWLVALLASPFSPSLLVTLFWHCVRARVFINKYIHIFVMHIYVCKCICICICIWICSCIFQKYFHASVPRGHTCVTGDCGAGAEILKETHPSFLLVVIFFPLKFIKINKKSIYKHKWRADEESSLWMPL